MNIFENISKVCHSNAHGEINFFRIVNGSVDTSGFKPFSNKNDAGDFIVGHSESGHHHLLEADGVTLMECQHEGMKMIYAILDNPTPLKQDASSPHGQQIIEAGEYLIGVARDYDPFTQQAKRVAD